MPSKTKASDSNIVNKNTLRELADDYWITNGNLGSKDAVLVFDTSILNKKEDMMPTDTDFLLNPSSCCKKNKCGLLCSGTSSRFSEKDAVQRSSPILQKKLFDNDCRIESDLECKISLNELSAEYSLEKSECHSKKRIGSIQRNCMVGENNLHEEEDYYVNDEPFSETMPAIKLKVTFKFIQTETKLLRKIFLRHGLTEVVGNERFSILWTGVHMKPDILRNLTPYQRVNHFPRSYELTRKDRLYKNIEKMQHLRGIKHFDIIPKSFVLPLQLKDLLSAHNKHRGPWIVKPLASSRGRGIFIVNSPDQISQDEQVLVSKYVSDPLCIDGHKCDLRVYVLVTSYDPLTIYLYKEGLVRLATVKYDRSAESFWNPCMHLCNYSINKYHSDYITPKSVEDEDVGHKWTLSALLRHLKSQGCDTCLLMQNIEDIIIKSIFSCAQSVVSACRMFVPNGNNCFELYGFDVLIDESLKPWLLEINLSPSMGVDSPLDTKVKACLVTDLLTCVGIPAISSTMRDFYDTKWTRFRNVSCNKRVSSSECSKRHIPVSAKRTRKQNCFLTMTTEEKRIIRNSRLQNSRRGGFVPIFPCDDSMQRYGIFLDSLTGIPISTPVIHGHQNFSAVQSHNYNRLLYENLYGNDSIESGNNEKNTLEQRMMQYETALPAYPPIFFGKKGQQRRSKEVLKLTRQQIHKLMETGCELTILQARQTFSLYLESVLQRLVQEPKDNHEKLLLKFFQRVGADLKAPLFFRFPHNIRIVNKVRSAMVRKLLCDFLEMYNRDTETYVDTFDHCGMIPRALFTQFLDHAREFDLEYVLTLHTNITGSMPFLYNKFGVSVPPTPPIPSGLYGFLRALPSMTSGGFNSRDIGRPSKNI